MTARRRTPLPARASEHDIQRTILAGLAAHGVPAFRLNSGAFVVSRPGEKRRFLQASFPGCPDLVALLPGGQTLWIECKSARGTLSPEQAQFRELCQERGVPHVVARSWQDVAQALRVAGVSCTWRA